MIENKKLLWLLFGGLLLISACSTTNSVILSNNFEVDPIFGNSSRDFANKSADNVFLASNTFNGLVVINNITIENSNVRMNGSLIINDTRGNANISLNANGDSYFRSGNVGVGVLSPSTRLDVSGSGGANGINLGADISSLGLSSRLFFSNGTSGRGFAILKNNNFLQIGINATSGGASGSSVVAITDTGKMGIGTTAPNYSVDIQLQSTNGSIIRGMTNRQATIYQVDTDANGHGRMYLGLNNSAVRVTLDSAGTSTFAGGGLTISGGNVLVSNNNITINNRTIASGGVSIGTTSVSGGILQTEGGNVYFSNAGIGGFTQTLSVSDGNTSDINYATSGSSRWSFRKTNSVESGVSTGSDFQLLARNNTGTIINTWFFSRGSGYTSFPAGVSLGVGGVPNNMIDVNYTSGISSSTSGILVRTPDNYYNGLTLRNDNLSKLSAPSLSWFSNGTTLTIRKDSSAYSLHVLNSSGLYSAVISTTNGNSYFQYDGGNFGIGTNSPLEKLKVIGNASITDSLVINYSKGLYSTFSTGGFAQIYYIGSGTFGTTSGSANIHVIGNSLNGVQIGTSASGITTSGVAPSINSTSFVNSGQTRMFINGTQGFIGINTTTPSETLYVNGNFYANQHYSLDNGCFGSYQGNNASFCSSIVQGAYFRYGAGVTSLKQDPSYGNWTFSKNVSITNRLDVIGDLNVTSKVYYANWTATAPNGSNYCVGVSNTGTFVSTLGRC